MKRKGRVNTASRLFENKSNPASMRPYIGEDGNFYTNRFLGGDAKNIENYEQVPTNNAALRYDEWRTLDDVVIKIAEKRLVGFDDLRAAGLVYNLNNAMGTTVLTWEEMSDAMEAFVSIDPVRRGDNDVVDFAPQHIPIPIVHADYQISERILQESRNRGDSLNVSNAERAARKVAEQLEDMLFGATATIVYGGGTIHSYISHPDVNDVAFDSAGVYWDLAAATGALILADVIAMKQALIADKHFGPYAMYIPTIYETKMDQDYDVAGASLMTIRERILKIEGVNSLKVVDSMPVDNVLMVQLTSDVVDLIDGMPMQNVQWDSEGGFVHHYKVMTIQVPRVKSDYNNASGICLLS
ncbi:hypothetical protein LCGC14_1508330 [marine sediment metagenome]|uniref:Encapsulating protein for peroxidase n=1 Tax=marine sediment metagenome TaxID=412755 RepID=A0A0F9J2C9_9ZZZZ